MTQQDNEIRSPVLADTQRDEVIDFRNRGLAMLEQYGKSPTDSDEILRQAIENLSQALELGDYTPETAWSLTRALRNISDMDGIIEALKKYADNALNLEQEFLARHYIVDNYSLIREYEEAVKWHKDLLQKMRSKVPPERLLWSLSDSCMMGSWKECGLFSEWMSVSNELYSEIQDTYETCVSRAYYLRTLIEAVYVPASEFESALETCDKLIALVEKYSEQWVEARWILTDVRGDLLSIYHATNRKDLEEQAVTDGKQYLIDYENWIAELSASGGDREVIYKDPASGKEKIRTFLELHRQYYQFSLHDFACQCMWNGHYKDAMELFEKALAIRDDAETHFFLAGSILKATEDRRKSFEHFRKAVENPSFSRKHELKQAFLGETTFEDVWDDEQFISLIDREVQKQVQQVKE
ncbi:MAG: hypothetical protein ACE5PV_16655 [Candidatus Poribacteria bacterium]